MSNFEPFVLDTCKDLFRNEAAFQEFVAKFEAVCDAGTTPLFSSGKIIGLTVSKANGKELLCRHISDRWAQDPALLERLTQSLREEPVAF